MACVEEGLDEEGSTFGGEMEPSAEKSGDRGTEFLPGTIQTKCSPPCKGKSQSKSPPTEGFIGSASPLRFHVKTLFEPQKRSSVHERFLKPLSGERRVLPILTYREGTPAPADNGDQPGSRSRDYWSLAGSRDHPPSPVREDSTS